MQKHIIWKVNGNVIASHKVKKTTLVNLDGQRQSMVLELDTTGDVLNKDIRGKSSIKTSDDIY